MKTLCGRALRALAMCIGIGAAPWAGASTVTTNFSDLWWNPAESGWGLNIAQQADVMFVTFYVYGPTNQPTWYTALLNYQGVQPDGSVLFNGDIHQSSGPYFAGPFNPALVTTVRAGTALFEASTPTTATLTYRIGSIVVVTPIERYTLRTDTLAGSYVGGTSDVTSNCLVPTNNGFRSEESGVFTITQLGTAVTIRSPGCTYSGNFHQDGQIGRVDASYTCTTGALGTVTFFDLRAEVGGVVGRYRGHGSNCDFDGDIGIARRK
jgi:hypothetical protein